MRLLPYKNLLTSGLAEHNNSNEKKIVYTVLAQNMEMPYQLAMNKAFHDIFFDMYTNFIATQQILYVILV